MPLTVLSSGKGIKKIINHRRKWCSIEILFLRSGFCFRIYMCLLFRRSIAPNAIDWTHSKRETITVWRLVWRMMQRVIFVSLTCVCHRVVFCCLVCCAVVICVVCQAQRKQLSSSVRSLKRVPWPGRAPFSESIHVYHRVCVSTRIIAFAYQLFYFVRVSTAQNRGEYCVWFCAVLTKRFMVDATDE